ncbi:peptidase T [Virgibacillus kimchii]
MWETMMERFITYAKIDTQSDESSETTPSTPGQLELARLLVNELKEIGMEEVTIDEHGYVMATLPANTDKDVPVIGFIAHLDTSPDFTGKNVNPQIIERYMGKDITLNEELNVVIPMEKSVESMAYFGHPLITTDGTTLLGADNKAGIAEIITAMDYLIRHPEIKHGKIRVAFTPDEEIGRSTQKFNIEKFAADYAYTVNGRSLGEIQYENFNAAAARIIFKGVNIHPGAAKNKMVNSGKMAAEFIGKFPEKEAPEYTDFYEGFYHLISVKGDVERTEVKYIIRDFDKNGFRDRKETVKRYVDEMENKYGEGSIELEMKDEYYNMREKIEPVKEVIDIAYEAIDNNGVVPAITMLRGGTDSAQLSYMGLPTPNLFSGGENFHSNIEYISLDNMEKATNVIIEISRLFAHKS